MKRANGGLLGPKVANCFKSGAAGSIPNLSTHEMNTVDIISGLIIGGAGSFLAAALMLLVKATSSLMASGLRVCAYGFLIMGIALAQAAFVSGPYAQPARLVLAAGPLVGMLVFGYGFNLIHQKIPNTAIWLGWCLSALLMILVGYAIGERAFGLAISLGCLIYSGALTLYCWPHLKSRETLPQRVMGVVILGVVAISFVRLIQTFSYTGEPRDYMLYVPLSQLWFHALFYGVMPLMTGIILVSIINARLTQRLQLFVETDELTETLSRRGLRAQAAPMISKARKARREIITMMLDLDNFKAINDRHGHQFGDLMLQAVAHQLRAELREESLLGRFGGEEFVALIPFEGKRIDSVVAERLRRAVRRLELKTSTGEFVPITISIGCALVSTLGSEITALDQSIQNADMALYEAKAKGRDRVELHFVMV
jgi:diguanylate cyclase (GGDEF)-like protein